MKLNAHDLQFILKQIEIAEQHSAMIAGVSGTDSIDQIGDALRELVDNPLLPNGLRTVDGSYNNLVPGRERWGASGEPFPQLTQPNWVNEEDDALMFGTPTNPVWLNNNNYASTGGTALAPGQLAPGTVVDADPRIISNLIVDQTLDNPAAIAAALRHAGVSEAQIPGLVTQIRAAHQAQPGALAALDAAEAALLTAQEAHNQVLEDIAAAETIAELQPLLAALEIASNAVTAATQGRDDALADAGALAALLDQHGVELDGNTVLLPNVAPDEGLSAPYNSWFTLFGQFFDHGLDLVKKGGNGTVYIPLQPDDPLYNPATPHTNFMVLTRVSVDDEAANVTTPWVDQNQTYTSHASHQVFLREYELGPDGKPVATGLLLEGANGGLATWKDIKDQARTMLGIELTDADVGKVPLLRTDPYGRFIPDPDTGYAQVIVGVGPDGVPNTADDLVISGTPTAPASLASAVRLPNAFLDDIAHAAVPVLIGGVLQADSDSATGYSGAFNERGQQTSYDNEMLDAHFITGDGRGNENIGLTAVHYIFHAEHNRQVEEIKATITASGDAEFIASWKHADGSWDGERLFQAARVATEMQYQHLVFEEFARKIQPDVDLFIVEPDVDLNPAIFAEFANVVYRFGHSMLNQSVDRIFADGSPDKMRLFDAFLNPLAFETTDVTQAQMAGAIALGMSAQRGNEIDEFVTDVLRNQLVGIPLDLAAINIARGRDTGMPTLNQARAQFQELANGDTLLRPYTSWSDFATNLKNPESIINFIAAYGTHSTVTSATTAEAKRDAAINLVFGGVNAPSDRLEFLNGTGAYAEKRGGLDNVDLWVGGLAEKKMAFGGMLGSTFSFVFQLQMENLQDSDRFYYLSRAQGLNFLTELENNSLAKIVMRNTNLGEQGLALPADIFSVPDHVFYVDYLKQMQMTGQVDPQHDNPVLQAISSLVERGTNYFRFNGNDHIVIQGTSGDDHIVAGGGDDTVWGGAGNDRIEAGYGVDSINGGEGNDIITSAGTDIGAVSVLKGEAGHDVIVDGTGMSLIFGGDGQDYLVSGADDGEIRGGEDNDFIVGGDGINMLFGNEGDDWVEAGGGFDYIAGDNGELFFNSTILGHDVLNGGSGDTDYDADSGDDIMFGGAGIQKFIGMWGHDWVTHKGEQTGANSDMKVDIFTTLPNEVLRDRFSQVEGLSGWQHNDVLRGDDRAGNGAEGGTTTDPTPETGFRYNELNRAAIDRIAGLDQIVTGDLMVNGQYWADGSWEDGKTGTIEDIFVGGNILLGGGGSDVIEGRGGDDIIDGDRYLNVRVKISDEDGNQLASVDSLTQVIQNATVDAWNGKTLPELMVSGVISPERLSIVREILDGGSADDVDTAVYWDVRENYEITSNADGSITVAHISQTGGAIDPVTGRNRVSDGVDRLYNIEKLQFADETITFSPPELKLHAFSAAGNYATSFGQGGYGNSSGSIAWGPDWTESDDGANVSNNGQITLAGSALRFGTGNGAIITRELDLSTAASAQLSFSAVANNLDAGEQVTVFFSADGTTFEPLGTIGGSVSSTPTFDLVGPFTAAAKIRFEVSGIDNGNESVVIDNLRVDLFVPSAAPTTDLQTSYTENGAGAAIANRPGITDDGSEIASARIVLTNASAGDRLFVQGALPQGITAAINTSVAGIITLTLSGEASLAAYQSAIQAVRFENTSDAPAAGQRLIEITVNDGIVDSNVAVASINVVPVDDDVVANNDTVITNISGTTSIVVPKWALLANDVDPDSPISITGVGNANSLTNLSHNASSVSFTDPTTGNAGGSFTYTATGAPGDTANATVNVTRDVNGTVDGTAGNNILIGNDAASTFDGGLGNDIILAGGGNDTIVWNANNAQANSLNGSDGRDIVDGGAGTDDTFVINGNTANNVAEFYRIYSREAAEAAGITGLNAGTEIVITRGGTTNAAVIAELWNIEEIVVNTDNGNDTVQVIGDFANTSLDVNTITINGGAGDDTVDISALTSAHRIVFRSNGGNDTIIGSLRPQDVVELPAGSDPADYERSFDPETGISTLSNGQHQICFSGDFDPVLSVGDDDDDDHHHDDDDDDDEDEDEDDDGETCVNDDDDQDDDHDDDEDDCGCDDDNAAPPASGGVRTGTAQTDVLIGSAAADSIVGFAGDDVLIGNGGDDAISAGEGADLAEGGAGNDVLAMGGGDDIAFGGEGNDLLFGDAGDDRLFGGAGDDRLEGGTGNDFVVGGAGNDLFVASAGDGNDTYYGDDLEGGTGIDTLDMSAITANITVNLGTGLLGRGNAYSSQTGSDTLWSIENVATGSGNDTITASDAVNVMEGGAGNDTFRFTSGQAADGDTILDFEPGDRLDLSGIDADRGTAGDQAFTIVSGSEFTASAQLLVTYETREDGEYTVLRGNVDGGPDADFELSLKGTHVLNSGNVTL
ncbi:hypothetical protein ASE63_23060 [Bosea sp. Root381]|uniref:peroxidase family protein n=1 Tax=Bosea sp. Root381 TaxID=1736524 RepID=UPI0006F6456C|nr:peroxidase family protein [Bosea sp. Root381]KRE07128.1 hypothetical protein ASE63_23060 [Bosea sp. Root381]